MRKINFEKLAEGDLVQVPRYQFAPMRHGWNGWLFSDAVVLSKGFGKKTGKPVVKVEMRTPGNVRNDYGTLEKLFFAECVFVTDSVETAKEFMQRHGVSTKEEFEIFRAQENVTGCDWIKFLIDKGYLFNDSKVPKPDGKGVADASL